MCQAFHNDRAEGILTIQLEQKLLHKCFKDEIRSWFGWPAFILTPLSNWSEDANSEVGLMWLDNLLVCGQRETKELVSGSVSRCVWTYWVFWVRNFVLNQCMGSEYWIKNGWSKLAVGMGLCVGENIFLSMCAHCSRVHSGWR